MTQIRTTHRTDSNRRWKTPIAQAAYAMQPTLPAATSFAPPITDHNGQPIGAGIPPQAIDRAAREHLNGQERHMLQQLHDRLDRINDTLNRQQTQMTVQPNVRARAPAVLNTPAVPVASGTRPLLSATIPARLLPATDDESDSTDSDDDDGRNRGTARRRTKKTSKKKNPQNTTSPTQPGTTVGSVLRKKGTKTG